VTTFFAPSEARAVILSEAKDLLARTAVIPSEAQDLSRAQAHTKSKPRQ